ncbi:MAG TPA: diguanylate cyclase [Nitrospirota bacterium]|nr:diguanylate cyclase [Nitrospirota bacterium]
MNLQRSLALLHVNSDLHRLLEEHFESVQCRLLVLTDASLVLGVAYAEPPDVIIIDLSRGDPAHTGVLMGLKQDSYFSEIPVLGLFSTSDSAAPLWDELPVDDFVSLPLDCRELQSRILLSQQRIRRIFDNNPLSKLPGNTSIQHAIEQSLGAPRAVCYLDINNFKPYNDTYGFSRGDEVLRMVARITANAVRESCVGGFVGHVGGDDFVFITPKDDAEAICKRIIDNFNVILSDMFSEPDKVRGFYVARDRKGVEQQFPLLGVSLAVVPLDSPRIQHAGKVAEIAAELKKLAKKSPSSAYIIDRRK